MAKLFEHMVPGPKFWRLFAFGFIVDRSAFALATDTLILIINFLLSVYGYCYATKIRRQQLPGIWDVTTVMTTVKQNTYLLAPLITMISWQLKRRTVTDLVYALDEIVSSIQIKSPKLLFPTYFTVGLPLLIVAKIAIYGLLQFESSFKHFAIFDYAMIVINSVWIIAPVIYYLFLIETIRQAVRDINDRLTGVGAWKTYRGRWKELKRTATSLARIEFGVTIITLFVYAIAEVVFDLFMIFFVAYTMFSMNLLHAHMAGLFMNAALNFFWMVEVLRTSHNCRSEVGIPTSVTI